jgi:hypothetical protein
MNIVRVVTSVNKIAGQRLSCGRVVVVLSPFRWRLATGFKQVGARWRGVPPKYNSVNGLLVSG